MDQIIRRPLCQIPQLLIQVNHQVSVLINELSNIQQCYIRHKKQKNKFDHCKIQIRKQLYKEWDKQQKLMSSKKIPLQKAYVSSSSQQQQHKKRHQLNLVKSRDIHQKMSKTNKGHSQNLQYSVLEKMTLREDIARGDSGQEQEDGLRILDEESYSSEQGSQENQSDTDQHQQYTQREPTSRPPSQPITQQLDPLQKKRLQILQKLEQQDICSPQQYESIIIKLQQQNEKLQSDLEVLKQKVDLLRLKQMRKNKEKTKTETQNKRLPEEEYKKLNRELKNKYKELQKLQKKSSKSSTSFALEIEYREFVNKLIQLQNTCQTLRSSLKDEKKIQKNLKNQLKKYTNPLAPVSPQAQQLETYNKQLKNKLFLMKKILTSQEQSQMEIHKFNIEMKERQKKIAQAMRIKEVARKREERKDIGRRTRLATIGGGDVDKLETRFGTMKLYTMDSKVRARTEFSFQDKGLELAVDNKALMSRNHSAMTQVAQNTPKSIRKSAIFQSPHKKSIALPSIPFTPLNSHQITTLNYTIQQQTQNIQALSQNLQSRLNFLQQQLNPNFKRQGSPIIFSKEKDMLVTKNKLLIQEIKSLFGKKIELLREYNIVERYYGAGEEKDMDKGRYNSTEMQHRQSDRDNNPTFPRIGQVNEFNRSRSEMKFIKINSEQRTQILRRSILSAGKSLKNHKRPDVQENNVKKSPSMPTYNNGRSQTVVKKPTKEQLQELEKQRKRIKQEKQKQMPVVEYEQSAAQADLNFSCLKMESRQNGNKSGTWKQDFIGQICLQECHFDDRIYASIDQDMQINELIVHHSNTHILMIQARYKSNVNSSSHQQNFITELSYKLPLQIVQSSLNSVNVVLSTTELSVNDYIKQIKVFYNVDEGYVARLQVVSKFNVKYDFGNKSLVFPTALSPYLNLNQAIQNDPKKRSRSRNNQGDKKGHEQHKKTQYNKFYAFDIKPNEYPGFIFGNYRITQTNQITLCGLGFTINKQPK